MPAGPDMELAENGGSEENSYGGGGGRLSEVAGELVLFRTIVLREGEKSPLGGGNRGLLNALCDHGCGVLPVGNVNGVKPLPGKGQYPFGVKGG